MTKTYTTIADLVAYEIIPALGDAAADFDIDGIVDDLQARDLIVYVHTGNLSRDGFQLVADEAAFWDVVSAHDTTV